MDTSPQTELDRLESEFRKQERGFLVQPFSFTWWVHGGEPGPGYISGALTLSSEGGRLEARFVRASYDLKQSPPQSVEKLHAGLESGRAFAVLHQMFQAGLFAKELPEERDRQVADGVEETWKFHRGEWKAEKTMFEPFPEILEPLRAACRPIVEQLRKTGARTPQTPGPKS